jgi:hypothetical protein
MTKVTSRKNRSLAAAAVAFLLVGAGFAAPASAQRFQFRFGTQSRPLQGRSFQTMRALSHYLGELSEHAASEAQQNAQEGTPGEERAIAAMTDFATRASDFHERMDNYQTSPWVLPREVQDLDRRARRVNAWLGAGNFDDHVISDWYQVVDTLERMKRVLYGQDVDVPVSRYRGGDYEQDYKPVLDYNSPSPWDSGEHHGHGGVVAIPGGGGVIYIEGANLNQVRSDLHALDAHVSRAHEIAEAAMNRDGPANQRFFERIHAFNERTHELHRFIDMNQINPHELRPLLEGLGNEARSVDQALRESHAIPEVWNEWAAVLQTIDRMMGEVRY